MLSIRRLIRSKDLSWAPPLLELSSSHHRCNLIFSPLFSSLLRTRAPRRRLVHPQVVAAESSRWSTPRVLSWSGSAASFGGRAPPPRPPVVGRRRRVLRWSGAAAASSGGRAPPPRPPVVGRRRRVLSWSGATASFGGRAPPLRPPVGQAPRVLRWSGAAMSSRWLDGAAASSGGRASRLPAVAADCW
jgi:hypothetical protein